MKDNKNKVAATVLTDERIHALWKQAIEQFQRHEAGVSLHPSVHLAREIEAELLAHAARLADGYESGFFASSPQDGEGQFTLHYKTAAQAESATLASQEDITGTTGGSLTLQQLADGIADKGVMSSFEFRHFLNGDEVALYPHQLLRMVNLFAAPASAQPADPTRRMHNW